jgi:sugar diacid utilization regulator
LGIDLSVDQQVIGHYFQQDETFIPREVWQDGIKPFINEKTDVFVMWGRERFILIKSQTSKESKDRTLHLILLLQNYFKETYNLTPSFGIGQRVSAKQLTQSFEQAESALATAIRHHSVVFDEDLQLEMLVNRFVGLESITVNCLKKLEI